MVQVPQWKLSILYYRSPTQQIIIQVFNNALKMDRKHINIMENNDIARDFDYTGSLSMAYLNEKDLDKDETFTMEHDDTIPPVSTISISCLVRYKKDDHVEVGKLVGVNSSDPASPVIYEIPLNDDMKVQTTREHIGLEDTPDVFAIPTKAKSILEVSSYISKKDQQDILNPGVLTPLRQLLI